MAEESGEARAASDGAAALRDVMEHRPGRNRLRRRAGNDPTGGSPLDALDDLPRREETVRAPDGTELAVLVAGHGGGTPRIVLAHCWTGDRRVWGPVARRLVSSGHEVVLYDQRGHGRSTVGTAGCTLEALGDDLALVLEHVDAKRAVLAGHSMGGMAVQSFAARHPDMVADRIAAALLASTASTPFLRGVRRRFGPSVVGRRRVDALLARPWVGPRAVRDFVGRNPQLSHLRALTETFRATPGPVRMQLLADMRVLDLTPGLEVLRRIPVTVVVGTRDRHTPPDQAMHIVSLLPHARLVVEPDAGHMLPYEAPDLLARLLAEAAAGAGLPPQDNERNSP